MSEKKKPINNDWATGKCNKKTRIHRNTIKKKDYALKEAKKSEKNIKSTAKTDCGVSAKQSQDIRNAEYFKRLNAGEVDDLPPMPNVIKALMLRDDLDRPI